LLSPPPPPKTFLLANHSLLEYLQKSSTFPFHHDTTNSSGNKKKEILLSKNRISLKVSLLISRERKKCVLSSPSIVPLFTKFFMSYRKRVKLWEYSSVPEFPDPSYLFQSLIIIIIGGGV